MCTARDTTTILELFYIYIYILYIYAGDQRKYTKCNQNIYLSWHISYAVYSTFLLSKYYCKFHFKPENLIEIQLRLHAQLSCEICVVYTLVHFLVCAMFNILKSKTQSYLPCLCSYRIQVFDLNYLFFLFINYIVEI